jgi:hypothetical protein
MRKKKKKIAIFSCMMGGYDIPTDNFEIREGYDYYLFLDKAIHTECWQLMKPMFTNEELSPAKKSRFIKTHPFAVLPDYDIVVWVDANTTIDDKLYNYIDQHKDKPITFKQHPYRDCIYEEIKMCCLLGKETQPMCLKLFERYNGEHFPTHYGLYENNVIIYHPHDPIVQEICNAWWNEIENFSHRDQLSLTYVLWKNNLKDFINVGYSKDFNPKKHLLNK